MPCSSLHHVAPPFSPTKPLASNLHAEEALAFPLYVVATSPHVTKISHQNIAPAAFTMLPPYTFQPPTLLRCFIQESSSSK